MSVVYPRPGRLITARDSSFIFGSVGDGSAGLRINDVLVPVWPNGAFMGWLPVPPANAQHYDIVAFTARDTVRVRYPVRTVAALPQPPASTAEVREITPAVPAILRDDSLSRAVSDTDAFVIGRPSPTGTYRWFLFPGTPVLLTGELGEMARVDPGAGESVWVQRRAVHETPGGPPPPIRVDSVYVRPSTGWVDIVIPAATPPAYRVDETEDGHGLVLTLYGVARSSPVVVPARDSLVKAVRAEVADGRLVLDVQLGGPVFGYLALHRNGAMILRVRRPPVVDAGAPLRGLTIVVDPGHPPAGATGPTGLWEPVATLAVGERLRELLVARGAHVVMTRTGPGPVALGDRPIIARRANADALVSIHLNALPDGMNPFRESGTGTYYFHRHSVPLARAVQEAMVPRLGLHDRGIFWQNLALARPTWFPAILTEGLFVIMPDQEAAIRTPQYQEAYARGIADGLERFFASLAR